MSNGSEEAGEAPGKLWYKSVEIWAFIVAALALLVSGLDTIADWSSSATAIVQLNQELKRTNDDETRFQKEEWQEVQVFQIIQAGTKQKLGDSTLMRGMTFEEIKSQYQFATLVTDTELPEETRKESELRKVLLNLVKSGVIYHLVDDSYAMQRASLNQRADRFYLEEGAKYAILNELALNPGTHKVPELFQSMKDKKIQVTVEEYHLLINHLISANAVLIDESGKLYSVANPPPKRK